MRQLTGLAEPRTEPVYEELVRRMAVVYASYSLRMKEKQSVESSESRERVENGDGEPFNCTGMSDVFIVHFTFLAHF